MSSELLTPIVSLIVGVVSGVCAVKVAHIGADKNNALTIQSMQNDIATNRKEIERNHKEELERIENLEKKLLEKFDDFKSDFDDLSAHVKTHNNLDKRLYELQTEVDYLAKGKIDHKGA